ncbi:MAG TPA: hypothetical protein VKQ30_17575 [Ktedonobacterales bacterium]|nr:hypothetical protein [Ktedonobacterales bacterium]
MSGGTRAGQSIVTSDADKLRKERFASLARAIRKLSQGVLDASARRKVAVAKGERTERPQPVVVAGQTAYQ